MREFEWQELIGDTGDPNIDPSTLGALAKQAGVNLGELARASGDGTAGKVFGTLGEGLRDAGVGAGIGASLGSVIPGIGTLIGGAAGAVGGAIVGVVHHLLRGRRRKLTAKERQVLARGLHVYKTRHLPGAFQDAVLYVYHPAAYRRLRAQRRLPAEIEARLLKQRAYAARAAAIDRQNGARMRAELAHLPHEVRTLVGVGAVTGHARELHVALDRALAEPEASTPAEPIATLGQDVADLSQYFPVPDAAEEGAPDSGAPPTSAEDVRAQILANPPAYPPPRWDPLPVPVQMYFWDPFDRGWTRLGDGHGDERAKALLMMIIVNCRAPVAYGILHTPRGSEVIRAVKNTSPKPGDGDHFGEAQRVRGGVTRMWTPEFTFYSRTFRLGEAMQFDLGREVDGETGAVTGADAAIDAADPFLDLGAPWTRSLPSMEDAMDLMPSDVRWAFATGRSS